MKHQFIKSLIGTLFTAVAVNAWADIQDVRANLSKLHVPDGFHVDIYAEVPGARQMALGTNGNIYVGTRGSKVYAVVDKNKDHKADQVVAILDDLNVGNGVAMVDGHLYVAEQNRITRYAAPDFDLTLPFKAMREVIYDKLPNKAHHGWRYLTVGPDNKLYVSLGAPCNICDPVGIEASIIRMNPDGSQVETFAKGVRNSEGMDFQPGTNTLFFTDNGVDLLGADIPHDELNAAPKAGLHFGFPYFAGGDARDPNWKNKTPPTGVTKPVAEFQAHSANLGFKFYTGKQFPAEYQGNAVIAQHGSWNRKEPVGYQLVRVTFDEQKQVKETKVFIDGWLSAEGEMWGRPTDVLQLPDGSLLVSDDFNGVIYRISYDGKTQAATPVAAADNTTLTGFQMPESVFAAPSGITYISEIGEFGKLGDGKITQISPDGSRKALAEGLNDPKGLDMFDNQLYVADMDRVVRVDAQSGQQTVFAATSAFPRKPVFLNDVEIDGLGNVYVSDSGDDNGKGAGIFKITPAGKVTEVLKGNAGIKRPNGLLMDGPDSLLVADFGTGKLFRVQLGTKPSVSLLNQGFGGADGLIRDANGMLYISDWAQGNVWQLVEPKATPQRIIQGYQSAADISLSADGQSLLIPDMKAGTLHRLPLH
ncbi:Glucose/arabinose dehydrogenase, beta-propeller fold [Methylophilus rhizosphaerae]|uniref:Glucose/arabinose dehydrogenase, beta-propeller fold n=1 Tax=Methylophilus rhizosphaerae TaxID=492660 RepID=A0A1G9D6R8_9PROT|nr:PQQ-dependent sugar dehydrogenase [Methylophilus rhizosphaerae]SDK59609.1 Glucose/arabinose dehydrogenase, beta-propeller fold [Methylophilus rhizosphaerae]